MADLKQAKTFTEGVQVTINSDRDNEAIFADNLDIAQSPAQIVVDNSDSKNDEKNMLDDIMNEEDSSEEEDGSSGEKEDDQSSKEEKPGDA